MINISIKRFQRTILELTEIRNTQRNINESNDLITIKEIFEDVKSDLEKHILDSGAQIYTDLTCDKLIFSKVNIKSIFITY